MKKIVSSLVLTSTIAMSGGTVIPVEPTATVSNQEDVLIVDDSVQYNGFYLGGGFSYARMNSDTELRGYALTLLGGYYFNQYVGVEARYMSTISNISEDTGAVVYVSEDRLSNLGIYIKPMYNFTTGFSIYGLAGYGQSEAGDLSERGGQWGLGAKYELANGVGLFFDYMRLFDGDDYDGKRIDNTFYSTTNFGGTYTF